ERANCRINTRARAAARDCNFDSVAAHPRGSIRRAYPHSLPLCERGSYGYFLEKRSLAIPFGCCRGLPFRGFNGSRSRATSDGEECDAGEGTRRRVLPRPTPGPMLLRRGRQLRLLQRSSGAKTPAASGSEIGTAGVFLTGEGTAGKEGNSRG